MIRCIGAAGGGGRWSNSIVEGILLVLQQIRIEWFLAVTLMPITYYVGEAATLYTVSVEVSSYLYYIVSSGLQIGNIDTIIFVLKSGKK